MSVAANARTVGLAATDEDRSRTLTVTGTAAALLATVLLLGDVDFTTLQRLVRALLAARKLPADGTLQEVGPDVRNPEDRVVEFDITGCLGRERLYFDLHDLASSSPASA